MAAVVASSFDVAFWFMDRAREHDEYLQPQKLQRLLYLAQAYFAAAHNGRMLMPAVILADTLGPVEPSVFRMFEGQIPGMERRRLPDLADRFLDAIWRRFGQHSADYLNKLIAGHAPYAEALAKGERSVITLKAMALFYGRKDKGGEASSGAPSVESLMPPRMMRSQSGQAVTVKSWAPPSRKGG